MGQTATGSGTSKKAASIAAAAALFKKLANSQIDN
jgi:dsRNA-specific ribonuclease